MTKYLFYTQNGQGCPARRVDDSSIKCSFWKPSLFQFKPPEIPGLSIHAYWLFHQLHIFKNREYTFLVMTRNGDTIHYAGAYPGYFRFPFMSARDMQIGYVWTDPNCRGQGLAALGVELLVNELGAPGRSIWYVVDRENKSSIRVAEKTGFHCVGEGCRQPLSRFPFVGAYHILEQRGMTVRQQAA